MSSTNTVRIHRVFAAKPEKVYRAFLDPAAMAKWISPNGFTCTVHHMDAKVGGTYRMSFQNFTTQKSHAFGGTFKELEPHKRLVYTDKFEDPKMPNEITVTVLLKEVSVGTEVHITQENLPDQIPVEGCYLGWQDSMKNLQKLVEPDIQDDM
jgi:uncharacterized protein YndB with AHSA1/START domain